MQEIEDRFEADMNRLMMSVEKILDNQVRNEPAMDALQTMIHGGIVLRWTVLIVAGTLALVGTTATAVDILKGLFKP